VTQERLVNLAIMSIESDILREIDFTTIITDFVRKNQETGPDLTGGRPGAQFT